MSLLDGLERKQGTEATIIASALEVLIGRPLSIAREAADMRVFHFGAIAPKTSGPGTVGSHALHIQCSWRIVGPNGAITGYSDRFDAVQEESEIDPDHLGRGNLQRARLLELLGEFDAETNSAVDPAGRHIVVAADIGICASLDIVFSNGNRLQVFPDSSGLEDWRFFDCQDQNAPHLVVLGGRIEPD
jgi:hypothetical protein